MSALEPTKWDVANMTTILKKDSWKLHIRKLVFWARQVGRNLKNAQISKSVDKYYIFRSLYKSCFFQKALSVCHPQLLTQKNISTSTQKWSFGPQNVDFQKAFDITQTRFHKTCHGIKWKDFCGLKSNQKEIQRNKQSAPAAETSEDISLLQSMRAGIKTVRYFSAWKAVRWNRRETSTVLAVPREGKGQTGVGGALGHCGHWSHWSSGPLGPLEPYVRGHPARRCRGGGAWPGRENSADPQVSLLWAIPSCYPEHIQGNALKGNMFILYLVWDSVCLLFPQRCVVLALGLTKKIQKQI